LIHFFAIILENNVNEFNQKGLFFMKCELLKRTAIALFVGSVISTYSVAEGSISAKSSIEDVTNAINKNGENISKVKKDVSDLAKSLKGDAQNPGLLDALDEANKGINENKEALAKKADKEDVNKIKQNVSDLAKSLKGDAQNPGLLDALDEANKGINENKEALAKKVDKATVDAELAKKADKTTVEQNTKEIEKIKNLTGYGSLTEVENKVKEGVSGKADKKALEDLKKEVKDNEEGIGELSETVSEIDDNVVGLTDAHNELLKDHNNLVEDVKAFNEAYNKFTDAVHDELDEKANASDVYTKTESDSKLDAKADKQALEDLKKEVKDNEEGIGELDVYTKTESDSKLNVKANASDVYTKTESDSKLNAKANVADVYSKTETDNKFALKADNSVVSAHTKRLDHLDNRVNKLDKDLKRGLAAQAALTGLFQPYTVGKANFTAAVGGYKSQTAVAIGTGYRYNQNIATKAGVAFTQGGGVTYNAGVNFEW